MNRYVIGRLWFRVLSACVTAAVFGGCQHWERIDRSTLRAARDDEFHLSEARVSSPTDVQVVQIDHVQYPSIFGVDRETHREVRIDVERWQTLEIERFDGGATALVVLMALVGVSLLSLLVYAGSSTFW